MLSSSWRGQKILSGFLRANSRASAWASPVSNPVTEHKMPLDEPAGIQEAENLMGILFWDHIWWVFYFESLFYDFLSHSYTAACLCLSARWQSSPGAAACAICHVRVCTGLLTTMLASQYSRYLNEFLRLIKCATCRDHWMPDCCVWEKAPKAALWW